MVALDDMEHPEHAEGDDQITGALTGLGEPQRLSGEGQGFCELAERSQHFTEPRERSDAQDIAQIIRGPHALAQEGDALAQQLGGPGVIADGEVDLPQAMARTRAEQRIAELVGDGDRPLPDAERRGVVTRQPERLRHPLQDLSEPSPIPERFGEGRRLGHPLEDVRVSRGLRESQDEI